MVHELDKNNSFCDCNERKSFQKESFDPADGSPYFKRRFNSENTNDEQETIQNGSTQTIYNFNSPNNQSPYIRRKYENDNGQVAIQESSHQQPHSPPNQFSHFAYDNNSVTRNQHMDNDDKYDDVQELSFPVEIERHQSMSSLRHQRDPHYQGVRSRKARRVVSKSGDPNIGFAHIPQKSWRFAKDFVNTLIDEQWRYVITVFSLSFFCCWILFAILWYLIAYAHGDLNFDPKTGKRMADSSIPCVENAFNFVGFLLFSIETQVSIGYGSKYPNEECPEAIFLMIAQIICGVGIQGAMVGIVYAKMIRPPRHASSMQFSTKALICQRDSRLCLVFRVCDSRENQAINSRVHAYWFEERRSPEGEHLKHFQHTLQLENNGRVFLLFPITICHVIDKSSPLYDLSAQDLLQKKFEIVATLTGLSNLTGQMIQARTSYLPREIMWGYRFINMVQYDKANEAYATDYDKFDEKIQIDTPLCSAKRLEQVQQELINDIYRENEMDHCSNEITNQNKSDKINNNNIEGQDYFVLSPNDISRHEECIVNIRCGEDGTIGCLETRFSRELCAEELTTRLNEHRKSLDEKENQTTNQNTIA